MTIHLLYIDDDPAFGRLIQKNLARLDYDVTLAGSGDAGLSAIATGTFDAVALDHYMPDQDGIATLSRIMAETDPPPVIYVTGTNEGRVAVAALKAGAVDYVVKEVAGDFVDLLDVAIKSALAGTRVRRERDAAHRAMIEARDRFEALAEERQMLMREVNHRVGNSLQLVAAFLHLQSSGGGEETRNALSEANRRVLAIAQVHRRLYASDDVKSVALAPYLSGLVDDIRASADGDSIGADVSLLADDVAIDPDSAVAIGVIVTELVINAIKYAYPGGTGPIRVSLHAAGEVLILAVEDDGAGLDLARTNSPTGIGRTIIGSMAGKLGATMDYMSKQPGTRASLTFPMPSRSVGAAP